MGVEGNIVITNTSAAPIEAWTLSFDSNFTIDNLWNGRVLENNGTSYTVAAEMWTNPVQPNGSMTIGFVGSKAADVEALLSNFRLTEVVIGEGIPVIPIDPTVEEIEITANAVYDVESGNISVSWTSNKQDGTFDILMSEDGENFVSVGAVEGASEFVYTPANDFETLYFKVVQTVGEQTAESNVVAVAKSAEDIAISAEADYDKETGKITVSWTSNKENGIFEVFVSEDGENYTSVGIVENIAEFVYSPNDEFEVLYFKVKQAIGELSAESNVITVTYPINWEDMTDTDNDGLTDVYEKYHFETDPTNPDTDGDGLPDGYEVYYLGTDPTKTDTDDNGISDGDEDFDKDGLSNLREYELGTNPNGADSDSDGLTDGDEVNKYNTDPLKYDTDSDGISDCDEIALGLDPASAATDGTPDSERTFVQHIGEDSDNFAAINTSDNPYKVSIDITAAGVAANNLSSHKSGYSNAMKNKAILGISPEFTYTEGLKVEDVIINFDLDNSVVNNTNGKYTNISDEFIGIKRYNVFKFFEDTNMLLPIETFHDVENNRVYTHVDELGTYCLIDMEIWLEGLEIAPEDFNSVPKANQLMLYSLTNSDDTTEEEKECLDVVLVAYPHKGLEDTVRNEMVITSNKIFKQAANEGLDVRIFYVSFLGSAVPNINDNTLYATNIEDAQNMIKRIPSVPITFEPKDYALYKSMKCITSELSSDFREDSNRFCFVVDALTFPKCSSNEAYVDKVKNLNFNVHFVCSSGNENYSKYFSLSTDHICSEILVQKGRYNFGDFIFKQIFGNVYPTVTAVGWTQVELNSSLQQNYEWYQQNTHYNEFMDTDHDGLADYQEIKFATESGRSLVDDSDPTHVELLTFAEIVDLTGDRYNYFDDDTKRFYVKDGLKRYMDMTGEEGTYPSSLVFVHILPIRSDPTSKDSDEDGICDDLDGEALCSNEHYGILIDYINEGKIQFSDVISDEKVSICTVPITDLGFVIGFEHFACYDEYGDNYNVDIFNKDKIIEGYFDNWYIVVYNSNGNLNYGVAYTTDCQKFVDNNSNPFKMFSKAFDSYAMSYETIENGYVEDGFWKTEWNIFTGKVSSYIESVASDLDSLSVIGGKISKIFVPNKGNNIYFDNSDGLGQGSNTLTYAYKKFEENCKWIDDESDTYKAAKTIAYTNQMMIDTGIMIAGAFIATGGETVAFGGVALAPETGGGSLVVAIPAEAVAVVGAEVSATGTLLLASDIQGYNSASQTMRDAKMLKDHEYKAGDKTPRGREFTVHGAERANSRGFTDKIIDSIIDNNMKKRVKEIDDFGQVTWRYQDKRGNTVVTNEWGDKIVTVYSYPESINNGFYIPKE